MVLYEMCYNTMVCYALYSSIVLGSLRRRRGKRPRPECAGEAWAGLECHEMTGRMTALLAFDNLQLNLFVRPSTVFPTQDVAALLDFGILAKQRYATVNYQLVVAVRAKVKQGVALLFL